VPGARVLASVVSTRSGVWSPKRSWATRAGLLLVLLWTSPAGARAAVPPTVGTGRALDVSAQAARLVGTVEAGGATTGYQFQYGPTRAYGAVTPVVAVPRTAARRRVVVYVTGLAPATRYHFRLLAHNARGLSRSADRTFTTRAQPLGVAFRATPNPVAFGGYATLNGRLRSGHEGRQIVLESNPFPYTRGFEPVGNALLTDGDGAFSFGLQPVPVTTLYRVSVPEEPAIVSPIVVVAVSVRVGTRVGTTTVTRGRALTFAGTIRPAVAGARIIVQKRRGRRWVAVARTVAHRHDDTTASYRTKVAIRSSGRYRVYAAAHGGIVAGAGRVLRIATR
jgi:hypothetical protein